MPPSTDSNSGSSSPCWSCSTFIEIILVRLALAGYAVLAVFSFLETRKLLNSPDYAVRDNTLYVPVVLCLPNSIQLFGQVYSIERHEADSDDCRRLDFLVSSAAISMLFSTAAVAVYLCVDIMARTCPQRGPFNKSSAVGMGLFLIFILLQTGIGTMALVDQIKVWVRYFRDAAVVVMQNNVTVNTTTMDDTMVMDDNNNMTAIGDNSTSMLLNNTLDDMDNDETNEQALSFVTAQSYANTMVLTVTAYLAFACCLAVLIDSILFLCCTPKPKPTVSQSSASSQKNDVESGTPAAAAAAPLQINTGQGVNTFVPPESKTQTFRQDHTPSPVRTSSTASSPIPPSPVISSTTSSIPSSDMNARPSWTTPGV